MVASQKCKRSKKSATSHPVHNRPKDVLLWSYFGQDVPDHNRTKLGRIRFLTHFGFAMSGMHLESENIEKFP